MFVVKLIILFYNVHAIVRKGIMPTVLKVSFENAYRQKPFCGSSSGERHRQGSVFNKIASMSNEDIINASAKNACIKVENSNAARVLKKGPLFFIAAISTLSGAFKSGTLTTKAGSALKCFAASSLIYTASKPIDKAVCNVMDLNSDDDNKKSKELPFVRLFADLAAIAGVSLLLHKGAGKTKNFLAQNFSPAANDISGKLSKFNSRINSSKFGVRIEKFSNSYDAFASKHPFVANFIEFAAPFLTAVGFVNKEKALGNEIINNVGDDFVSNVCKLSACRETAKDFINSDNI